MNYDIIAICLVCVIVIFIEIKIKKNFIKPKSLPINYCIDLIECEINCMNGRDFEEFVSYVFSLLGNKVKLTPASRDGGVDIILNKTSYVECKRYAEQSLIGTPIVYKLIGACFCNNIKNAIIITTSGYTTDAKAVAELVNHKDFKIQLWTKKELLDLCRKCNPNDLLQYFNYDVKELSKNFKNIS